MVAVVTLTLNPAVDLSTSTERVVAEDKLRCDKAQRDPGGGGVNVARAATRLGTEALAVVPVGGTTGRLLCELLGDEGVQVSDVEIAAETRESWSIIESATDHQYRFVLPGAPLTPAEVDACLDRVDAQEAPLVVASGSLPPDVPDDTWARLVRRCADAGRRTIVDSSGPALRAAVDAGAWLVKPNLRELAGLVGEELEGDAAIHAAARDLLGGGTEAVVVSMGAGGAALVTADGVEDVRSPTVPIRSRVGAGDSAVAGIVRSLARGDDLATAVRWGVAAGAAAVMTEGSELCRADDTERLFDGMVGGRP